MRVLRCGADAHGSEHLPVRTRPAGRALTPPADDLSRERLPDRLSLRESVEQFAVDRALVWIAEIAAVWMAQTLDEAEAPLDRLPSTVNSA